MKFRSATSKRASRETGAINFVAGMILDYVAFDTFGESTVLFVAACSVLLLLKLGDHAPDEKPTAAMLEAEWDDRHHEPKTTPSCSWPPRFWCR